MKVIFTTHYSGWGGANKALLQMILWLRRKYGVEALVLMASKGPFAEELENAGVKYENVPFSAWRGDYTGFKKCVEAFKFTLRSMFYAVLLAIRYRKMGFDIVHGNSSLTGFAYFLSRTMRLPLVWHQRENCEFVYHGEYFYGKWIAGRMVGQADRVIVISDFIGDYYRAFVMPSANIVRIYDGVEPGDLEMDDEPEHIAGINADEFNVCMVGGVSEGKNQLEVLKALACLKKDGKIDGLKFHIIGGERVETGYGKVLSEFIRDNGLDGYVVFHGVQRNVGYFYRKMDVSICASKGEGFGLVVVEAMMCGTPMIVNDQGALPELVKDGVHGYVYHLGKPQELAEAILKVKGGGLGPGIRDRVKEYALRNFSAERNADEVYALYKRVLGRCQA